MAGRRGRAGSPQSTPADLCDDGTQLSALHGDRGGLSGHRSTPSVRLMRAAIIGTGGIARIHARLIRELGGELAGVCGRTLGAAQSFSAAPAYDDLARLLREQMPDIVHICSPNHLHAEQSMAALRAGAHVLCEKPMAISSAECEQMMGTAAEAGRIGAIAYTYRGYPLVEVLRHRVARGEFGPLRRVGGC